ncbi:MerR family transcriptional regulator [Aerococcus kribbianus]|uniref:MerR family transcriptional regulator n=1 Tax=Aerococcus kribbianus TaxID=2999064 RepID=A0A9X3FND4_9LACT|nr:MULTISPECIES: MerR family transcriptional regulator [unclassified Aerococcus]MCZ0717690.1 MerR family transcriptional regulator [Aerococcus sp. YH-aer221]MCZ0725978.1 MerR family transcriptional regulator [Aerococcus sp. YH-aer222]
MSKREKRQLKSEKQAKMTAQEKHAKKKEKRQKRGKIFTWVMLIAIIAPVLISAIMAVGRYFGLF